jgi:hypothetical protein
MLILLLQELPLLTLQAQLLVILFFHQMILQVKIPLKQFLLHQHSSVEVTSIFSLSLSAMILPKK